MLKESKKFIIEGKSIVEGKEIAVFRAVFETENKNISFLPNMIDSEACKENRIAFRKDREEFEDFAYSVQEAFSTKNDSENK